MQHKLVIYLEALCKKPRSVACYTQGKYIFVANIPIGLLHLAEHHYKGVVILSTFN